MSSKNCSRCGFLASDDALFCPRCGNSLKGANADPLVGATIADRYKLVEKIGEGNSGTIYRGEHVNLGKKVAVKVLHHELSRDDGAVERFRREATTVGEIDNDHIVSVIDFGRTFDGRLFFAMEFLDGQPLSEVIKKERQLAVPRVVDILGQVCEALSEAHGVGFVHRDLRPRNIMLIKKRGKPDFVKLLDFGLSKLVLPSEMKPGQTAVLTIADPRYLAPELLRGEAADRRSDLYALGVIAYEMLTGSAPFEGTNPMAVLEKVQGGKQPSVREKRSDVPEWLDKVVQAAMARNLDQRFVTALKMGECLEAERAPAADDIVDKALAEKKAAEDKAKREADEKAKREAEEKARRDAAADKAKRESEEKAKREAEEKAKREAAAADKAKREADEKAKREADEKAKREAADKAKREADEKAKREAEEKAQKESEARHAAAETLKREVEEKLKREADEKARREADEKAKREAEEKRAAEEKRIAEERAAAERKAADDRAAAQRALQQAGVRPSQPAAPQQMQGGKKSKRQQKMERRADERQRTDVPASARPTLVGTQPAPAAKPAAVVGADAGLIATSGETASDKPMPKDEPARATVELAPDLAAATRHEAQRSDKGRATGGSGKHSPVATVSVTGEHERVWFDDSSSPKHLVEEHYEDEPGKKSPLFWGAVAASLLVVGVLAIILWPRQKQEVKERSYDEPAASAKQTGAEGEAKPPEAQPAAEPAEPAAAVTPDLALAVAVAEPAKAPEPEKQPEAVVAKPEEKQPEPAAKPEEKKPEEPVAKPEEKKPEPVAVKEPEPVAKPEEKKAVTPAPKPEEPKKIATNDPAKKGMDSFRDPFSADAAKQQAQSAELLLKSGRQKLNSGDISAAQADFKKARDLDSKSAEALAGLGECAFEQGDYAQAASQLKQAVRLSKKARYRVLLGQAYYKLDNYQGAADECGAVVKNDAGNQEASNCLQAANRKLGK